jgi:hypothetical protein
MPTEYKHLIVMGLESAWATSACVAQLDDAGLVQPMPGLHVETGGTAWGLAPGATPAQVWEALGA